MAGSARENINQTNRKLKKTSQGSVKVLPNVPDNKLRQLIMNSQSTAGTINKKLGLTAQRTASLIEEENKKPAKVVKVNSANPTRQGSGISGPSGRNVAKVYRPMGRGGAVGGRGSGGGLMNNQNR